MQTTVVGVCRSKKHPTVLEPRILAIAPLRALVPAMEVWIAKRFLTRWPLTFEFDIMSFNLVRRMVIGFIKDSSKRRYGTCGRCQTLFRTASIMAGAKSWATSK